MAAGFPVKENFVDGDVYSAANVNDLAGTVNLIKPTAKGDLFAGSAANTYTKLAVGTNKYVLTADSSTATGLKWNELVSGLNQVIPTSVAVGSGSGSVDANGTVTFSGASSISLNGCFTSTYENYRILFMGTCATSNQLDLFTRLRASGTDASGSTDYRFFITRNTYANGAANQASTGASTMQGGTISNLNNNYLTFEASAPFSATNTTFLSYGTCKGGGSSPSGYAWVGGGMHTLNTSYDGITFYGNGENISGTIRVYGYRN